MKCCTTYFGFVDVLTGTAHSCHGHVDMSVRALIIVVVCSYFCHSAYLTSLIVPVWCLHMVQADLVNFTRNCKNCYWHSYTSRFTVISKASARLFCWSAADWSRPAKNRSISSDINRNSKYSVLLKKEIVNGRSLNWCSKLGQDKKRKKKLRRQWKPGGTHIN